MKHLLINSISLLYTRWNISMYISLVEIYMDSMKFHYEFQIPFSCLLSAFVTLDLDLNRIVVTQCFTLQYTVQFLLCFFIDS